MSEYLKRFKRVLQIRKTERELVEVELSAKRVAEEKLKQRVMQIHEEREGALLDFCSEKDRLFSPQELWFQRQNLDIIEQDLQKNSELLEFHREDIARTEIKLREKHKDYRLMEQYVDTIRENEDKSRLVEEQNRLDDITSVRYIRTARGGSIL